MEVHRHPLDPHDGECLKHLLQLLVDCLLRLVLGLLSLQHPFESPKDLLPKCRLLGQHPQQDLLHLLDSLLLELLKGLVHLLVGSLLVEPRLPQHLLSWLEHCLWRHQCPPLGLLHLLVGPLLLEMVLEDLLSLL